MGYRRLMLFIMLCEIVILCVRIMWVEAGEFFTKLERTNTHKPNEKNNGDDVSELLKRICLLAI